jgi:hypothetical protein
MNISVYLKHDDVLGDMIVSGYNKTHGFSRQLDAWWHYEGNRNYDIAFNLPDDGSTWIVTASCVEYNRELVDGDYVLSKPTYHHSEIVINTQGTFTGVSVGQAVNAANAAKTAAQNAKSSADAAHSDAQVAANRTYYSGKSSARWGYDNYNKIAAVEGIVNNLDSEMDVMNTKITNIENTLSVDDTTPPTVNSIRGYKNATCTTTSEFKVTVDASDPTDPVEFRVKSDTGPWSNWTSVGNYATATDITGSGAHILQIEIRDGNDNCKSLSTTIFKI